MFTQLQVKQTLILNYSNSLITTSKTDNQQPFQMLLPNFFFIIIHLIQFMFVGFYIP